MYLGKLQLIFRCKQSYKKTTENKSYQNRTLELHVQNLFETKNRNHHYLKIQLPC